MDKCFIGMRRDMKKATSRDNYADRDLIEKEHQFLMSRKEIILNKAIKLYNKQMETGIIETCYCNFEILEKACNEYDAGKY